jgi:hypothetical protein
MGTGMVLVSRIGLPKGSLESNFVRAAGWRSSSLGPAGGARILLAVSHLANPSVAGTSFQRLPGEVAQGLQMAFESAALIVRVHHVVAELRPMQQQGSGDK